MTENGDESSSNEKSVCAEPAPVARELTPAARRALAEADERRQKATQNGTPAEKEVGGRSGPDPIRYGDWEKGGIASDF